MTSFIDSLRPIILNVGFAAHQADWKWNHVNSPFIRIYLVTEGGAHLRVQGEDIEMRPGYLYMIPAFTTHDYQATSAFGHYYVHLYEETPANGILLEQWTLPFEVKAEPTDALLFQRLCAINVGLSLTESEQQQEEYVRPTDLTQTIRKNNQRPAYIRLESEGIMLQILSHFLEHSAHPRQTIDKRIENAIIYIRKHINQPIELSELAEHSRLSKTHFIRLFKQEVGSTPVQYINRKKIEQAQLLLLTGRMPVKTIAYSLAIDDDSYFSRMFKKTTGVTPQEYRHAKH
jgi:AraC-like DNA-binding protein